MTHPSLFFAFEAFAPWPETFPPGRILKEEARHFTVAFLGKVPLEKALAVAKTLKPPYKVGPVCLVDQLLFLPKHHPRVAAYHFTLDLEFDVIQRCLEGGLSPAHPDRPLLNHITIARNPEDLPQWETSFSPFPLYLKDLHLFESLGHSEYRSHFHLPVQAPFEEIPHTADIAFHIWGLTLEQLYLNALAALGFYYPPIFHPLPTPPSDLNEIIIALNAHITEVDVAGECPFKAVSFHGEITKRGELCHWEMIVDV